MKEILLILLLSVLELGAIFAYDYRKIKKDYEAAENYFDKKNYEAVIKNYTEVFEDTLFFSSCGAQSVGLIFCWMQTADHNADYLKINSKGETLGKYDKHKDFENDFFSLSTAISCIGEEFKFEFPNTMHEIKGDPYIISLSVENSSNLIDYVLLKKVIVIFNESENVKIHYEAEICTVDGKIFPVRQDVNYTLKKETVKLYHPIFNIWEKEMNRVRGYLKTLVFAG